MYVGRSCWDLVLFALLVRVFFIECLIRVYTQDTCATWCVRVHYYVCCPFTGDTGAPTDQPIPYSQRLILVVCCQSIHRNSTNIVYVLGNQ